jgi:hypothetical protein
MPLPLFKLALAAGAGYYFYNRYRKSRGAGSQTNASEAVDDIPLGANPSTEDMLDAGMKETFPASDPVAVDRVETAYDKKKRQSPEVD